MSTLLQLKTAKIDDFFGNAEFFGYRNAQIKSIVYFSMRHQVAIRRRRRRKGADGGENRIRSSLLVLMHFPIGVVVSMFCWSKMISTLQASSVWIVLSRSISDRPTRSIAQAITTLLRIVQHSIEAGSIAPSFCSAYANIGIGFDDCPAAPFRASCKNIFWADRERRSARRI